MFGQIAARAISRRINLIITGVGLAVLHEVLDRHTDYINQLQREQFEVGITNEGTPIEPRYTETTKRIKAKKGQPIDRVTLKDTGSFYAQVFTTVFNTSFLIDSHDSKSEQLKAKYPNIFGLTLQSKQKLLSRIKDDYIQSLARRIKR